MAQISARPTVATVFGVLNIIFGVFGVIGLFNIKNAFYFLGTLYGIISLLSGLVSILLLVTGIFLILDKGKALAINRYYAYASLAVTIIGAVFLIYMFGFTGMMGNIIAVIIGVIYPLLILFVLLRNGDVRSYYSGRE